MRLCGLKEFRALIYTPESAPALSTLRANIATIPGGQRMGGRYYVDLDEFDKDKKISRDLDRQRNELANDDDLRELM